MARAYEATGYVAVATVDLGDAVVEFRGLVLMALGRKRHREVVELRQQRRIRSDAAIHSPCFEQPAGGGEAARIDEIRGVLLRHSEDHGRRALSHRL